MERRSISSRFLCFFILFLVTWFLELFYPIRAHAIPAFARKFNADCSMCHYPNVPRLNSFGHEFRRAGFRTPDEFNKDQDISKVGDFLSVRGRGRYNYSNPEGGAVDSEFQWHDTTFFYAGAMTKNLSSFAELEVEPEDETEVGLVASIGGVFGQPDHYSTFRIGQFHTLTRVGFGGFDRPTGINTASPLSSVLTTGGAPFKINTDQRGLELTHVFKKSRLIAQILNGINGAKGKGTVNDENTSKDYSIAYEQILDELASGFTIYGYWGTWFDDPDPAKRQRTGFARYALTGNKILPGMLGGNFEVMAGYVRSQDNAPSSAGGNVQGNAFFVELEQYFERNNFTLLARYDFVDPDSDAGNDRTERWTVGYVRTLQSYLRLAVEANIAQKDANDATDYGATAELMVNF